MLFIREICCSKEEMRALRSVNLLLSLSSSYADWISGGSWEIAECSVRMSSSICSVDLTAADCSCDSAKCLQNERRNSFLISDKEEAAIARC